jgi:hypothetical protein
LCLFLRLDFHELVQTAAQAFHPTPAYKLILNDTQAYDAARPVGERAEGLFKSPPGVLTAHKPGISVP